MNARQQFAKHVTQVSDERHVDFDVFVNLGLIDFDVDLLRHRSVGFEVAGDAIVEAHTECEQ